MTFRFQPNSSQLDSTEYIINLKYKCTILFQVKRARGKGGLAGPDGSKSVFGQLATKQTVFGADSLMLPHRVWKVKFVGMYVFLRKKKPPF